MKHSRILLVLTLIFTCGPVGVAQEQEGGKNRLKHNAKITKEYDRAKDQTTLSLELVRITCVKDGCIFFNLLSSFAGTKPVVPAKRFIFGLHIFTKTLEPFADSTLFLEADGKPIEVGAMTFGGKVEDAPAERLYGLVYGTVLYGEELRKIANARKVEMRIGKLQFSLDENAINAISDFNDQATTLK